MPRWIPDDKKVDGRESMGRRRFAQPQLAGAKNQTPLPDRLDYRDFEDSRGQVSLDRLGKTGPENQVTRYLTERAEATAYARKREFIGWRYLPAKVLIENKKVGLEVVASPILPEDESATSPDGPAIDSSVKSEPPHLTENVYHAHIEAAGTTSNPVPDPYLLALHLRELFDRHGQDQAPANRKSHEVERDPPAQEQSLAPSDARTWLPDWIRAIFRYFAKR